MNNRDSTIAFNLDGVHLVSDTTLVTSVDADCSHFTSVKAIGGDVVIETIGSHNLTGTTTDIPLANGDTLLCRFRSIKRKSTSTGWLALGKAKLP